MRQMIVMTSSGDSTHLPHLLQIYRIEPNFYSDPCDACLADSDCVGCPRCEDGNMLDFDNYFSFVSLAHCQCLRDESAGVCEVRDA